MATYSSIKQAVATAANVARVVATNYDSIGSLPTSGNVLGEQALVTGDSSTDRLYIWEGSAWYQVALIQNSPTFTTSPESTYALATDGATTTVITLAATDPEGFPVTFSATTNVGFDSIATLSQDSSVFTVTPFSEDSAGVSRTGTITFKASDGISVASAISTFTITFKIVNSNQTTMLLKASGNNGTNVSGITDASSSSQSIFGTGNIATQAFTPYHPGGYSAYFDDVGDNLLTDYSSGLHLSGDFTIECWFWPENRGGMILNHGGGSGIAWASFELVNQSDGINFAASSANTSYDIGSETGATGRIGTVELFTWNHLAVTREGNVYRGFVNGVEGYTQTLSLTPYNTSTRGLAIGSNYSSTWGNASNISSVIKGYVSDVRIVKGTALYTGDFTPPTERLTAVSGTTFLGCHLPYLADGSSSPHSISVTGSTYLERFGPYDHSVYRPSSHGSSVYFDGTNDALRTDDDTSLSLGTSDFAIEAWIYPSDTTTEYRAIISDNAYGQNSGSWCIYQYGTRLQISANTGSGGLGINTLGASGNTLIKPNMWQHIAFTRSGNTARLFHNGVQVGSDTTLSTNFTDDQILIGANNHAGGYPAYEFTGFISDVRVVKGSAVRTSAFTPPTLPLSDITNTKLLTLRGSPNIYNATGSSNVITLGGDAKSSTAQTKYADASILLDGSGDFLTVADDYNLDFRRFPFTMEGWYKADTTSGDHYIISSSGGTYNAGPSHFGVNIYQGNWRVGGFNDKLIGGIGSGVNTGIDTSWHHFAWTHNNRQIQFFVDGAQVGSTVDVSSDTFNCDGSFVIGGYHSNTGYGNWDGYLEDIRITKGLCRYPFIPFSETLTSDSNTTVLLCHADTIVDGSSNAATITSSGDPTVSNFGPYPGMKSIYFDGNDRINLETTPLGSGDFTVEGWVYSDDFGDGSYNQVFSFRPSNGSNSAQGSLAYNGSGGIVWYTNTFIIGSSSNGPHLEDKTWNHFALVRDNGTLKLFINGTMTNSVANTQDLSEASLSLAANNNGTEPSAGYISNFRISSTVRYTNSFTAPTAELKA